MYEYIFSIYIKKLELCESPERILIDFQTELQKIPRWNADDIAEQTKKVVDVCSFLDELLTMVFYANVKILSSVKIKSGSKNKKLKMTVPTNETFIHNVYKRVAKNIYNNPYLYSLQKYQGNVTNNIKDVFNIIENEIEDTIRDMLPMKNILQSLAHYDDSDDDEIMDNVSEPPMFENSNEPTHKEIVDEEPDNTDPEEDEPPTTVTNELPSEDPTPVTPEDSEEIRRIDLKKGESFFD